MNNFLSCSNQNAEKTHRGPMGRELDYVLQEREKFLTRVRVSVWLKKFNTV